MIREQKWIVVPVDMLDADCMQLVESNGACGYIRGVPQALQVIAQDESWQLPHVWSEIWDDEVP